MQNDSTNQSKFSKNLIIIKLGEIDRYRYLHTFKTSSEHCFYTECTDCCYLFLFDYKYQTEFYFLLVVLLYDQSMLQDKQLDVL